MGTGTTLVDKSGAGRFLIDAISAQLRGTVPAGQTITVVGEAYNSNGDAYNGTSLGLGNTTVTNDGTLVLDAQGAGKTSGGPAILASGTIRNNGNIVADVQDPVWTVQLQAGVENEHKGALTLTGGTLSDSGGAVTNSGTVTLGKATVFQLQEAATFSNESDGTIVTDIANAKNLGQFVLAGPLLCRAGQVQRRWQLAPEGHRRSGCRGQHRFPTGPARGGSVQRKVRACWQRLHGRLRPRGCEPSVRGCHLSPLLIGRAYHLTP